MQGEEDGEEGGKEGGKDAGRAAYLEADCAFHRALFDAGGNRLLGSLGRAIDVALEHCFAVSTRAPGAVEGALPAHRAVVEAVESGNPAAASKAVLRIIDATEREIAESLNATRK